MAFDKELLFKPRLPEADVEVPGIGTVRVRGLSRAEVFTMQKAGRDTGRDTATAERKLLALGLVDPQLTDAEAGQWQQASTAGELEPVTDKITELSGIGDGAAKAVYKEFEADPDAEFRDVPGDAAGDDGSPSEG